MGTKKFGPFLSAVAVSFCLGFGAVGCVATGFQLDVASMVTVAAVCLLSACCTDMATVRNWRRPVLILSWKRLDNWQNIF